MQSISLISVIGILSISMFIGVVAACLHAFFDRRDRRMTTVTGGDWIVQIIVGALLGLLFYLLASTSAVCGSICGTLVGMFLFYRLRLIVQRGLF